MKPPMCQGQLCSSGTPSEHGSSCIRRDIQHKFTTELARTCGVIGIEDLNVVGMMQSHKLARAVADAAMGQLLQFLKVKIANARGDLFIASRWFPSRHPLFVLWADQEEDAAQASYLSLFGVWAGHRQGFERSLEFAVVRDRTALPTSHGMSWPPWAVATTDDVKVPVEST